MSLVSRINDFALAVAADIKALFARATPAGGAVGQVLTKTSATDYATSWQTPSGGAIVIQSKIAAYTVVAGDLGKVIRFTGDVTGSTALMLPVGSTVGEGFFFHIWHDRSGTNSHIVVTPQSPDNIEASSAQASATLRKGERFGIVFDGSKWKWLYRNPSISSSVQYSSTSYPSASGEYTFAAGYNSSSQASQAVQTGAMALGGSYCSGIDAYAASIANNTSTYGAQATGAITMGSFAKVTASKGTAIGGDGNLVTGAFGLAMAGQVNLASGETSFATGERAIAAQTGKRAHGAYIAASGDNQYGRLVFGASTTGSAAVLTTNRGGANSLNQLVVATNQVMAFTGVLIGKQTGSANIAAYEIKGTLVNNGGVVTMPTGTLTLIGADSIALTAAPALSADNTNKALTITSGYKAATNIRWSCTLHSTELTYA